MFRIINAATIAFAALACSVQVAFAQVSGEYPGLRLRGDANSGMIAIAEFQVQAAVRQFYIVHGRWPASWAEVTGHGVFHTTLLGFDCSPINPDDGKLDFPGDVTYRYVQETGKVSIAALSITGKPNLTTREPNGGPATYREMFPKFDRDLGTTWFTSQLSNPAKMRLFTILGSVRSGLTLHKLVHGDYPLTWQAYLDSGLSPFTPWMLPAVPTTGSRFDVMDEPNGFSYRYVPASQDKQSSYKLLTLDENGNPDRYAFMF